MPRQGTFKNSVTQPIRSDKLRRSKCGRPGYHSYLQCPDKDVVCHNCGKRDILNLCAGADLEHFTLLRVIKGFLPLGLQMMMTTSLG